MVKFKVKIPVFVSEISVVYSCVGDLKNSLKPSENNEEDKLCIALGGSYLVTNYESGALDHTIWINSFYGFNVDTINTIVHESGHCMFKIFNYLGISIENEAEKHHSFLYCQAYLVSEIVAKLCKKVKLKT